MPDTYKIIRFFFSGGHNNKTIKRRLTLEQAQAHCSDPETSSKTCKLAENVRRTRTQGEWFDGYTKE